MVEITTVLREITYELQNAIGKKVVYGSFNVEAVEYDDLVLEGGILKSFAVWRGEEREDGASQTKRKRKVEDEKTPEPHADVEIELTVEGAEISFFLSLTQLFGSVYEPIKVTNGDLFPNDGQVLYTDLSYLMPHDSPFKKATT